MPEQIHGHEVMQMMLEEGASYTKESLRAAIVARFGPEARFCTCSAEDMTPSELIDFLEGRGKFIESGKGFSTEAEKICDHDHDHGHRHGHSH